MNDVHPPSARDPRRGDARNGMIFRFAVFFAGVAIGLVMLGMFQRARQASMQQRQTQQPAAVTPAQPGATPGLPTPAAIPAPAGVPATASPEGRK